MKVVAILSPAAALLLGALVPGALSEVEPAAAVGLSKRLVGVAQDTAELTDEAIPDTFDPAMPLVFFIDIDESKFAWADKDEIQPGETTCGFLNAPLGWPNGSNGWHEDDDDVKYPNVRVYVCVKFARVQPAPRGNMAVHCGGPGSLSDCVYQMGSAGFLGVDGHDTYNVIGFDQRGMGRSEPTFVVEECTTDNYDECRGIDLNKTAYEEGEIRAEARCIKATTLGCWKYPGFQLKAEDDSDKMYHFLEYSGTRQMAEDIERVRILFGDQTLSIYGLSYGTKVFGTYATIFPKNVKLMVLDANVPPDSDIVSYAEDFARNNNQRIDYFIAACEFSSECHVPNLRGCINHLNRIVDANQDEISDLFKAQEKPAQKQEIMQYLIQLLYAEYDQVDGICDAAEEGDYEQVKAIIRDMLEPPQGDDGFALLQLTQDDIDSESKPTSDESNVWPFDNYKRMADQLTIRLIGGQDYAFGAYDEDLYVRSILEWQDKYPGAGTRVGDRGSWYPVSYFFPNVTPLAPIGNPQVGGIISGQIYDSFTPYIWTQKMRERFPLTTLLTSRSANHGMHISRLHGARDPVCQGHIQRYFRTGEVDINDGHVCESDPIGDSCTINDILEGKHCLDKANGGEARVIISTE